MTPIHRRGFLIGIGGAGLTVTASQSQSPGSAAASAPVPSDVTRKLAQHLVSAKVSDLPAAVLKERQENAVELRGLRPRRQP